MKTLIMTLAILFPLAGFSTTTKANTKVTDPDCLGRIQDKDLDSDCPHCRNWAELCERLMKIRDVTDHDSQVNANALIGAQLSTLENYDQEISGDKPNMKQFEIFVRLANAATPLGTEAVLADTLAGLTNQHPKLKQKYTALLKTIEACRAPFLEDVVEDYTCQASMNADQGTNSGKCVKGDLPAVQKCLSAKKSKRDK